MLLQIITEGRETDLFPDTEITLEYENPFLATDHIPAPYSLTYELPLSPRNRIIFGFSDRAASAGGLRPLQTRILFGGMEITSGQQTVDETAETISVNYNGAVFPENVRQFLQYQSLGRLSLGKLERDTSSRRTSPYTYSSRRRVAESYNETLLAWMEEDAPDMVAPTIAVRGTDSTADRENFINEYIQKGGYLYQSPTRGFLFHKIIPCFRIGWIINQLLAGHLTSNVYDRGDLRRVMLVGRWHPNYQTRDDSPVYDIDPDTLEASVTYADFLPSLPANDFLSEVLKLPCATLYIKGSEYSIELNKDILARGIVRDWTDKLIGTPSLSVEKGQTYVCGYSDEDETLPTDQVLTQVETIWDMHREAEKTASEEEMKTYNILSTGQVIETMFDTETQNTCKYNVMQQRMNRPREDVEQREETSVQSYDNAFNGSVLKTNLRAHYDPTYTPAGTDSSQKQLYYLPEGDPIEKKRPEDLTVGLYLRKRYKVEPNPSFASGAEYPYMSHCNYDAYGNKLGDLSLAFPGQYGLFENFHREFATWVEKDKQVLRASLLLTPLDLHNLDLRDKFYIGGRLYFIRTLSVTLQTDTILPAEVEFIGA